MTASSSAAITALVAEIGVIEQNRRLTPGERFAARLGAEVRMARSEGLDEAELQQTLRGLVRS